MITSNKDAIIDFKERLNAIDVQSNDFQKLIELQVDLLKQIIKQEDSIKALKIEIKDNKSILRKGRLSKNDSKKIKEKISNLKTDVKEIQKLIYVYKCFGDGIAFKYISKWNLKRFLYEIDSPEVKSDAGSLSNKDGLGNELGMLLEATKNKVPAILNDLTNVIRHGDICLLGAQDPHVIEVKSSQNTNKRVKRQIDAINKIHNYLSEDTADIAGVDDLKRIDLNNEEVHFNKQFNKLFSDLSGQALAKISPENGIHYVAVNTNSENEINYDEAFEGIEKPMPFLLNDTKNEKEWGNYYPFTLSIKSPDYLYKFINGDVFIFVVLDFSVIEEKSKEIGFDVEFVFDGAMALKFIKSEENEGSIAFAISEHFFGRVPYEFLSLDWLFDEIKPKFKLIENDILSKQMV